MKKKVDDDEPTGLILNNQDNSVISSLPQEPAKKQETLISPFTAFSTIINIVLATGPFTIPKPFNDSGIILGSLFLLIIMVLAFITADFLIEVMAVANAIEEKNSLNSQVDENNKEEYFSFRRTIEVGTLAAKFWGRSGTIIVNLSIAIYLYGALCIKAVSASLAVSQGIAFIITGNVNGFSSWPISLYYVCDIIFFLIVLFLALKNVQNTKAVQNVIAVLRYLTAFLMILGALIYMGKDGISPSKDINVFDLSNFASIFGNVVFAFLCHHSLPGILRPIKPEKSIKKVLFFGYICGCLIMYMVAITALLAFGHLENSCDDGYPCKLQTLYNTNLLDLPFIGHIVNFYFMFNIAPVPILIITLRNNLMKVLVPTKIPPSNEIITKWTLLFVFLILGPCFIVSILAKDNLSTLLDITGGICGVILLLIIPSGLVIKARKHSEKEFGQIKHRHSSFFPHFLWSYTILILSILILFYSAYINISKHV